MNAIILLGTLKRSGLSNTATLCEFLADRMAARGIRSETIRLADHRIEPGTHTRADVADDWPAVLDRVLAAQVVIFATPIWWGNQSSLIQRVIERLDELHEEILASQAPS